MSTTYVTVRDAVDPRVALEIAEGTGGIRIAVIGPTGLVKFWMKPGDVEAVCECLRMLAPRPRGQKEGSCA